MTLAVTTATSTRIEHLIVTSDYFVLKCFRDGASLPFADSRITPAETISFRLVEQFRHQIVIELVAPTALVDEAQQDVKDDSDATNLGNCLNNSLLKSVLSEDCKRPLRPLRVVKEFVVFIVNFLLILAIDGRNGSIIILRSNG